MIFSKTTLEGAFIIEPEKIEDQRGFFARSWCQNEFESHGLNTRIVQMNIANTKRKGTLRGLHYQRFPHTETKLVRCSKGAIYDVVIDLRPNSHTYNQWMGVELSEDNYRMLYIPENFAQGYITLENNCEVIYQVSQFYTPGAESGIRWNDPTFNIDWPIEITLISKKDKSWPDYTI